MRIALFDSGYGGLTVLSHARRVLPSEEFIFYADRDHVPYGTKSVPAVRGFVRTAFRFLIEQQRADAVVVACNTATSVAVDEMRRLYDVPIIGMEPAVKFALDRDGAHRVLVTATPLTVKGKKMQRLLGRVDKAHLVDLLALPELVSFAERLEFRSPAVRTYLEKELAPYDLEAYSSLVLGCTHLFQGNAAGNLSCTCEPAGRQCGNCAGSEAAACRMRHRGAQRGERNDVLLLGKTRRREAGISASSHVPEAAR